MARRRIGAWYRLAVIVLRPLTTALTRRNFQGAQNLPHSGGFVVVVNHISHADFATFGLFMYDNGYLPRFLAKESVFRVPVIGRIVAGAQQIPVHRETADAAASYDAAVAAVRRGECVAVYPEGSLTRDPDLWPMRGKTGAARIALGTGCPVVPVAQWGAQTILPPYAHRPRLFRRHDVRVWAGPPVDLDRFLGVEMTGETVLGATDALMADLTGLLERIRGEKAPTVRWDPRGTGQPPTGNPRRPRRGRS